MKFTVTAGEGLPIGSYAARFTAAEPFDNGSSEYGPGVKLIFEVLQGEHQGMQAYIRLQNAPLSGGCQ